MIFLFECQAAVMKLEQRFKWASPTTPKVREQNLDTWARLTVSLLETYDLSRLAGSGGRHDLRRKVTLLKHTHTTLQQMLVEGGYKNADGSYAAKPEDVPKWL
jgi:hypothetical protein